MAYQLRKTGCKLTWPQRLIAYALRGYAFAPDATECNVTPVRVLYDRYCEQYRSGDWPAYDGGWDDVDDTDEPWMPMIPDVKKFGIELNIAIDGVWHTRKLQRIDGVMVWVLHSCKGPGSRIIRAYRKADVYDWRNYVTQT